MKKTDGHYVIDPKGAIGYKWTSGPGEKAIDAALEKLLGAAEADAKKTPK